MLICRPRAGRADPKTVHARTAREQPEEPKIKPGASAKSKAEKNKTRDRSELPRKLAKRMTRWPKS